MKSSTQLASQLVKEISSFRWDPAGFCDYAIPWGSPEVSGSKGPRAWQREVFSAIGQHLQNPETRHQPLHISISSGHGIGKTAFVSMLIAWAMSTCPDTRVVITSNTENQLRTKSWPEINKWLRLAINASWWNLGATSITSKSKGHERIWRTDAIAWSENSTESFAGLHNQGKRILLVFDEASAISDKIYEVAEGALTDKDTEIIWLVCGNPTLNTGRFRECFGRLKHRWKTFQIDSRTVPGTNLEQINRWIEDYGIDHDWVRVRVRGEFPRSSSAQFIGNDIVAACRRYKAEGFEHMPKILSVDVARMGDAQSVIVLRQGRRVQILGKYRGLDTMQLADRILEFKEEHAPNGIVVDGGGVGGGVIDRLRQLGLTKGLFEFNGGYAANEADKFFNRRAEVWSKMKEAIRAGIELPDDPEAEADLTGLQYAFSPKQQLQLEKKEDLRRRGLASPDIADAIAMSFAVNVQPATHPTVSVPRYWTPGTEGNSWMQM
jgi:hypothetical protein